MRVEVFEKLLNLNRNLERVIVNLKYLESAPEFDPGSVRLFVRDAEGLKHGVNRYVAERIQADADAEAVKLDALQPEKSEEEEP